jgi:glycosyltransferase involved in cell wall biosynthesis
MGRYSQLRVLHLQLELPNWADARPWSYGVGLGMEEGLAAHDVEFLTITTPWLARAPDIVGTRTFDQVWVEVVHQAALEDRFFDWVANVAPVRVGILGESLEAGPRDAELWPELWPAIQQRRAVVGRRLPYLTHVVAVDEIDAQRIDASPDLHAMWWPTSVPSRFVLDAAPTSRNRAIFAGTPYGKRAALLEEPKLKGLLAKLVSPENDSIFPQMFEALHLASAAFNQKRLSNVAQSYPAYLETLRMVRRECYRLYLQGLRAGSAIVNLPHLVKTYGSRVTEGMAVGRPIVSWEIPDRPRNRALFENGTEILLFNPDEPRQLADHLLRIMRDPAFAGTIAENGRRKLQALHTVEHRVGQILEWLTEGTQPSYA